MSDYDPPAATQANARVAEAAVAVTELADELGCHKTALFKIIARLGIQSSKRRDASRGNQFITVVTSADADRLREALLEGRRTVDPKSTEGALYFSDDGWFYLIQLEPEHDPGRFKVGFTTDLVGRLRHHRCSAPFAEVRRTWPCRRAWERVVIECMTAGTEQLHTEVFRGTSIEDVADRADRFFAVMPEVLMSASGDAED